MMAWSKKGLQVAWRDCRVSIFGVHHPTEHGLGQPAVADPG